MIPGWKVFRGDARVVLPKLDPKEVSLLLADPPYGIGERTDRKKRSGVAKSNDFPPCLGDDGPFDPRPCLRFKRVVLWGANHYADRLPPSATWIVWDKREGVVENKNSDVELAWTNLGGPARLFRHTWAGMIKATEQDQRRVHPMQKPVALAVWILERWTKPGDLVVDPYAGSGSTGVACVRMGRRYLGIELSKDYVKLARERIGAEAAGSTLEASRGGQEPLFKA